MLRQHQRLSEQVKWRVLAAAFIFSWGARAGAQTRDVEGAKRWRLGEPAPAGYHVARKHTLRTVGGSLLAGGYGISALYGLVLSTECYVPSGDGRSDGRACDAEPLYRAAPLLFIPVAGPFLALTKDAVRRDGGAVFWFSTFGAVQVAGAVLLAYDLAVPQYGLKRGELGTTTARSAQPRFWVAPEYMGRGPGFVLTAEF